VTPLLPDASALACTLLAGLRLLPTALFSPFLGGPLVPPPVRIGLALALGWAGTQVAGASAPPSVQGLELAAAGARELALGVALAFAGMLPVEAARASGRLVDTLRGATLSELHVAPIRQRESASGDLLAQWCVVLAAWSGGDRLFLRGLLGTFARIAPGGAVDAQVLGEGGLRLAAGLLACALAIAAPAAGGILAADLAIAIVERLAPGLGAVTAAQPARAALGVAAIALAASAIGGRLVALVALAGSAPALLAPGGSP
jgi:type III secretory pathway component EscT